MTPTNATNRPWMSSLAGLCLAGCMALAPALASAAENPVAVPRIETSATLPVTTPGPQTYVIKIGKTIKQVKATTIRVKRAADGTVLGVWADAVKLTGVGIVSVAVATGTGTNNNNQASYSQTTTTTNLPGGGTRTDIDHGDGSSTTIIHDPAGGKNGGSRTTTSTDDGEGNTTTTTTTTDGGDGSTTTTTTTSP